MEVRVENETVWLTQDRIAELFGVKRPAITKHLNNIFISGELVEKEVSSILELTTRHGEKADQVPGFLHVRKMVRVCGSFAPYTPERRATIGKFSQCRKCTVSEENKNSSFKSLLSPFPCLSLRSKLFLNYAENLKNGNNCL